MASGISGLAGIGLVVLRVTLGVIIVPHGMQKLFGLFGGGGIEGTAASFQRIGLLPAHFWAWVAALVEFGGGLFLIAGLLTRVAAFLLTAQMVTAIIKVHLSKFFVSDGGMEFALALAAMSLAVTLLGPGPLAADRVIGLEGRRGGR
jgi:putative oxidoreductase